MAFFDQTLILSTAQAITTTATSTLVYDITGAGAGNAPSQTFGLTTKPGADIGTGQGVAEPNVYFTITTTGTGAGTIAFGIEAAPDLGDGSNNPGTYVRLSTSKAYVGTTLLKGNVIDLPIPPYAQIAPSMGLPRFYRLAYDVANTATASVTGAILINPPLGYVSTQIPNNFVAV